MLAKLPIEIMDKIFDYLNLKDQLKMAKVSKHFKSVFVYNSRDKYKKIVCCKYSDDELQLIMRLCGHKVTHVMVLHNINEATCKLISQYCINIESAILNLKNVGACKSILGMNSLKTIALENMDECDLDVLNYINPECKGLSVGNFSYAQAENIVKLINLETLELSGLQCYKTDDLFKMCSSFKKLRVLTIRDIYFTTPELSIGRNDIVISELEELQITNCDINLNLLPKCPKLKTLKFAPNEFLRNVEVRNIIKIYAGTLEHFKFKINRNRLKNFSLNDFINDLGECRNIKSLHADAFLVWRLLHHHLDSFITFLRDKGFNLQRCFELKCDMLIDSNRLLLEKEIVKSEVCNLIKYSRFGPTVSFILQVR
ncbi:uncharacterized protein LOC117579564 [Drosophila guanche]|uniref:uncharacterized protein LOC117579564 n=1 Tax=Drosophila guanche TaxID=7266 RepID=UPI001470A5BD|nr:uncharacterized protein LOC117579564 [Drosophila guanche]